MGRVELVVRREGTFARVYAMKRLHEALAKDAEIRTMFLEEARIAGLIRHPNVVPVLDVGEDEFGPYLVMDFVEGVPAYRPLTAAVEAGQRLPVAFGVEVARQMARGLAAAHELVGAGGRAVCVIHRDISPQNVLLGFDGLVRVTDFGVARVLEEHPPDSASITGKIGYMSPEQIGRKPLDERSDLFSFGIVLYELLVCERLYKGERDEVFRRICIEPPPDVREVRPDVPDALAELLLELLAKTPGGRPGSAAEVAERLDAIQEALRREGQEPLLQETLEDAFADERERQKALVAAALEQTRAEIPLHDGGQSREVTAPTGPVPTPDAETRALAPPAVEDGVETLVERPRPRPAWRPRPLIIGIASASAVLIAAALGWAVWGGGDPAESASCTSSESCHARAGVGSFCDTATGECQSALDPICPTLFPPDAAADPRAILIGTIFDRSSPNQMAREHAADLAADGVNSGGGVDGRRVALLHCDASQGAAAAADHLVRTGAKVIVGPSTSADVEAAFTAHTDDDVLFITPSATATQLAAIDTHTPGLLWRTTPPDSLQSAVILDDILDGPDITRIVIVRRANDVYAQSLSVILQEAAGEAGLEVDASHVFTDAAAIPAVASNVLSSNPRAIVFLSSQIADAAAFLDAASTGSLAPEARIYFADAAANDDLFSLSTRGAPLFDRVRATRPAAPSTIITSEFVSDYTAAYGEDPLQYSFTAHTYDATLLAILGVAYALGGGGEVTGERIARGIARMSAGSEEHRLLAANLRATIAALRSDRSNVDVVGASGTLDFDAETEELTSATYEVLEVRGDPPRFELARRVEVPRLSDATRLPLPRGP